LAKIVGSVLSGLLVVGSGAYSCANACAMVSGLDAEMFPDHEERLVLRPVAESRDFCADQVLRLEMRLARLDEFEKADRRLRDGIDPLGESQHGHAAGRRVWTEIGDADQRVADLGEDRPRVARCALVGPHQVGAHVQRIVARNAGDHDRPAIDIGLRIGLGIDVVA